MELSKRELFTLVMMHGLFCEKNKPESMTVDQFVWQSIVIADHAIAQLEKTDTDEIIPL